MKKGLATLLKFAEKMEIKLASSEEDELGKVPVTPVRSLEEEKELNKSIENDDGFQSELDLLTKWKLDGTLKALYQMSKNKTPVWIKRSNGDWQQGMIHEIGFGGLGVSVKWFEDGRARGKVVNTKDFLAWQQEHP